MNPLPTLRRSAFSLIELLVVIGIIALIVTFAIPAIGPILNGSQLTQGSQILADRIAYARQAAIARNRPVEVRFYKYADLDVPGEQIDAPETWRFHGYQLFEILENGAALPISKMDRLPTSVVADGDKLSTLLREKIVGDYKQAEEDATVPEIPVKVGELKVGRKYAYTGFRYLQDGSTNLPPTTRPSSGNIDTETDKSNDSWYITLVGINEAAKEFKQIKNFFCLQIDPVTGATKAYRP